MFPSHEGRRFRTQMAAFEIGVCNIKEQKTMETSTTAKDVARELSEKEDVSSSESIRRAVKEIKEKTKEDKVEPILESYKK